MRNFRNHKRRGPGGPRGSWNPSRDAEIARLFTETAVTLQELGDAYGVTRQRIQRILKRQGVENIDGARSAFLETAREARAELQNARHEASTLHVYGCTRAEALALNGGRPLRELGTLAMYYLMRRDNVGHKEGWDRWQLTLPEWAELWDGKQLGSRHGPKSWVATRRDSTQPWTRDNTVLMHRDELTSEQVRKWHRQQRSAI